MSSSSSRKPRLGDIVLLKQGIGVIRYHGDVDFDEGKEYYGVELKGPSIPSGHNGTLNGRKYFTTTGGDGRGIFVRQPIRIISSEEILEKLAEIYDILKGRRGHSHFIDRATYDDLVIQHEQLKEEYQDKLTELDDLTMDLSLLKEQVNMMKGTVADKIDETAIMHDKIAKAERKLGSRLSQIDLPTVAKKLEHEQINGTNTQKTIEIPDYSQTEQTAQTSSKHTKQRSSMTLELDQLQDDFSDIARTVQAYGQKDSGFGPTHYRKFSNTTKQIMDQHRNAGVGVGQYGMMNGNGNSNGYNDINGNPTQKRGHRARGSMKIGDIVDEDGIDYGSDEDQEKLERESNDEEDMEDEDTSRKRTKKTRESRESRQLEDDEINNGGYFNDEEENNERESNEEEESENEEDFTPKRTIKTRSSRESRQLDDVEVTYGDENDEPPPQRNTARAARESRQLDDADAVYNEDDDESESENDESDGFGDREIINIQDDALGNNMQIDSIKKKTVKRNKARGSFQLEQPILSASILETHNEHHMEDEAAAINGPKGDESNEQSSGMSHKKSDTMTSDSSAYRAFMSVD